MGDLLSLPLKCFINVTYNPISKFICWCVFRTEVTIYIQERSPTGATRRLSATELYNFLNQNNIRMQLQQLTIVNAIPKTGMTHDQQHKYLETPPAGNIQN